MPAEVSKRMSVDLKRRGFRFVGPTIMYAFMQACGLVNDHVQSCHRCLPAPNDMKEKQNKSKKM